MTRFSQIIVPGPRRKDGTAPARRDSVVTHRTKATHSNPL